MRSNYELLLRSLRSLCSKKFEIGQESGHKADPEKVSRDMRYAMTDAKKNQYLSAVSCNGDCNTYFCH